MDIFIHYLTLLAEFVGSGFGVWFITEGVKRLNAIPINEGDTAKIRAVAGALSVAATLLVSWMNGTLDPTQVQNVLLGVLGVAVAWLTAHSTHKVVS